MTKVNLAGVYIRKKIFKKMIPDCAFDQGGYFPVRNFYYTELF